MATQDLDPVFVKALKLLHSKAEDSTAQLKAMLDDAIAMRKGLKLPSAHADIERVSNKSKGEDDSRKSEKRPADKTKDPTEPESTKAKLDPSKAKYKEEKDIREKDREREKAKKEKREREEKDVQRQKDKAEREKKEKESNPVKVDNEVVMLSDEESSTPQMDVDDFAFDLGISCVICKQFDVKTGNQLVECQECHNLYHQECHKPPVTDKELSDPRFVWYCHRCARTIKKMVAQKPVKPKPTFAVPNSVKEGTPQIKSSKTDLTSASQAFRRIDPKTSSQQRPLKEEKKKDSAIVTSKTSSSQSSSKPFTGLAGLAANLSKPRHDSKSSHSKSKVDGKGDGTKSSKHESKHDSSSKYAVKNDDKPSKSGREDKEKKHKDKEYKDKPEHKDRSEYKDKTEHKEKSEYKVKTEHKEKTEYKDKPEHKDRSEYIDKPDHKDKSEYKVKTEPKDKSEYKDKMEYKDKSEYKKSSTQTHESKKGGDMPTSPSSLEPSGSNNKEKQDKQAIANLNSVTAMKRVQMMKKKAQSQKTEKKMHIK